MKGEASFPKADRFRIEAVASYETESGSHSFNAVITENYTEFTNENLPIPVRYENGLLTCGETSAEIDPKKNSLFRLSGLFSSLFEGGEVVCRTEDGVAVIRIFLGGQEITVEADAETLIPSAVFADGYTIVIQKTEFE